MKTIPINAGKDTATRTSPGIRGVVMLSGDRHLAEISRLNPEVVGSPIYDLTSSSLNPPSGNTTKSGTHFANEINRNCVGLTYFDTNFGLIQIDWTEADPVLRFQICDELGGVVLQQRVRLSELQAPMSRRSSQRPNLSGSPCPAASQVPETAVAGRVRCSDGFGVGGGVGRRGSPRTSRSPTAASASRTSAAIAAKS